MEETEKRVAIRRWGDACFHLVDEVVEEGFILSGHLISREDVTEVREVGLGEACPRRPVCELRLPTLPMMPPAEAAAKTSSL